MDGEIGIGWWANDFDADLSEGDIDAGSLFLHGETWLGDKWGIRGAWYDSDFEGERFSDQTRYNLELRRRLFKFTDNNFVALGAGFERIDLENGETSNGLRVSAEGRFGVPGPVFFFGKVAWIPVMQDAGEFEDISATEIDAGVHFTPIPFMSLRFGYLQYELDFDDLARGKGGGSNTSGFYLGAGLHW